MNVYILTDMEGISLVTEWEQVQQGHPFYSQYQPVLSAEVNAAVEGALAAGAKRIVVNDGHGSKNYNLLWEHLNPMVEIERPDSAANLLPSLDESFHAVLLVGYHSMEGTPNGVLSHTQNHNTISYYEINGQRIGEIGQMAIIASGFGVPVAYVSGDQAAVEEARELLGSELPGTIVKWGHPNRKATSLHPGESARRIREDVEQALQLPRRNPLPVQPSYEVTICFKTKETADLAAASSTLKRMDDLTVSKTSASPRSILL